MCVRGDVGCGREVRGCGKVEEGQGLAGGGHQQENYAGGEAHDFFWVGEDQGR